MSKPPSNNVVTDVKEPVAEPRERTALGEHTPLPQTTLDRYGRRSLAFREEATGGIISHTEVIERTLGLTDDDPVRLEMIKRYFHRMDGLMCFMLFENVSPSWRSFMGVISFPYLILQPWCNNARLYWELWRSKRTCEGVYSELDSCHHGS